MVILLELRREMHKDKLRKKLKIPEVEVEEKKEEKKRDWLKWLLLALVLFVIIKRR